MNRTLVLAKPDAVERGLAGEIIARLERKGLRLVAMDLRQLDEATARAHYTEHDGKSFFGELISFITSSPVVAMVVEGPEGTWEAVRTLMGDTDPMKALPGTIRGDLATLKGENLVHGSDGPQSAAREIALFFPGLDG